MTRKEEKMVLQRDIEARRGYSRKVLKAEIEEAVVEMEIEQRTRGEVSVSKELEKKQGL